MQSNLGSWVYIVKFASRGGDFKNTPLSNKNSSKLYTVVNAYIFQLVDLQNVKADTHVYKNVCTTEK